MSATLNVGSFRSDDTLYAASRTLKSYLRSILMRKWDSTDPKVRFGSGADITRSPSNVRFAPESGQSNLLRAVQDHRLRRENDKAYAPSRMSIKGSSDSSIPSVSWPGRKSNFFSASALSGTTLSTVKTPSSATLRSSGQAADGSLVESPAAASCAFR